MIIRIQDQWLESGQVHELSVQTCGPNSSPFVATSHNVFGTQLYRKAVAWLAKSVPLSLDTKLNQESLPCTR